MDLGLDGDIGGLAGDVKVAGVDVDAGGLQAVVKREGLIDGAGEVEVDVVADAAVIGPWKSPWLNKLHEFGGTVGIVSNQGGTVLATAQVPGIGEGWRKYEAANGRRRLC